MRRRQARQCIQRGGGTAGADCGVRHPARIEAQRGGRIQGVEIASGGLAGLQAGEQQLRPVVVGQPFQMTLERGGRGIALAGIAQRQPEVEPRLRMIGLPFDGALEVRDRGSTVAAFASALPRLLIAVASRREKVG